MSSPQMLDRPAETLPRGMVLTNRIIWFAMVIGELSTAIVLGTLTAQGQGPRGTHPGEPLMAGIAFGLLAIAFAVSLVVPRVLRFGDTGDEAALRQRYAARMIVPMAALEAAAFVGMVFVFLIGKWMPIGIVPVAAIVLQVTAFPRGRLPA
jgi:hypothetical protein